MISRVLADLCVTSSLCIALAQTHEPGPSALVALTLAAALPSASNRSLLAERGGADDGRVARTILASTAMAVVSFSLLAWAFGAVVPS